MLLFGVLAAAIFSVAIVTSGWIAGVDSPNLLAAAIAFDLLITVPLAFYFLVIRRNSMSLLALGPIVGAGWLAAYFILPVEHRAPLYVAEIGAIAFEAFIIFTISRNAVKAVRDPKNNSGDPLPSLRNIAADTIGNRRLGIAAGTEIAALYYAIISWFTKGRTPESAKAFSYHRRSGLVGIALILLFALVVETVVLHVVVSMWSPTAAWIITALSIYGGIWLLGHFRASVLRHVLVDDQSIAFKSGLLYDFSIPLAIVKCIAHSKPEDGKAVSAAIFGEASHWIVLNEEIEAEGAFGFTTKLDAVGFTPDEPTEFEAVVGSRIDLQKVQ